MRDEQITVEAFTIYEAATEPNRGALDPINVFLRDLGGQGQIVVECYGSAWSHWFGAIGQRTLRQFLCDCNPDYIADKLICTVTRKTTKHESAYVHRIAKAVHAALLEQQ